MAPETHQSIAGVLLEAGPLALEKAFVITEGNDGQRASSTSSRCCTAEAGYSFALYLAFQIQARGVKGSQVNAAAVVHGAGSKYCVV